MTFKEKLLQKSNLWHVAAVGVFLLIACVYFYPALDGYSVKQSDVKSWIGASQEVVDYRESGEQIGWTASMFGGMPTTQISMAYDGKQIPDFFRGALALWLPAPISILFVYFIGFYILAIAFRAKPIVAMVGAIAYGLSSYFIIILEVGHVTKALAIGYAPLLIAGFIFAYRWKNWVLGVALSGLFMSFQLSANHLQITYYLVFVMVALGGVELFRYIKMEEGGLTKFFKITACLLVAYGVAVMINIGSIVGTQQYVNETTRGGTELTIKADGSQNEAIKTGGLDRDYITHWSYGKAETFTFLVPNYKGGPSGYIGDNKANAEALKKADNLYRTDIKQMNQYWGDQPGTSGPVYIGAIVVLLALLSLAYSKEASRWPLFVVTLVTVMLSWGKNLMGFTDFFLDYLPGYDKFRAVTIILVIAELCIPLLGVFFLQKLYQAKEEIAKNIKPFLFISGGVVFILLMLFIAPGAFSTFLSDGELDALANAAPDQATMYENFFAELQNVRMSIFTKDVGRSLLFVLLGAGVIFAYIRNAFNQHVAIGIIGVLILADLIMVDTRYLNTEQTGKKYNQWIETYKQKLPYTAGDGERQILALEVQEHPELAQKLDSAMSVVSSRSDFADMEMAEKQRVIDWTTFRTLNRYTNFRVLEEGNPFNSSYTSYFNKSLGGYHGAKLGRYQEMIEFHLSQGNPSVLDMLNMKYTLRPQFDARGEIINSTVTGVNSTAMGNAWLAKEIKVVANADEEIMALNSAKTFRIETFGEHGLLVNGKSDSVGFVVSSDQVELIYMAGLDSLGNVRKDTVPVQVPFPAVTAEMPLVYVLTAEGVTWDYLVNVDSSKVPLLAVKSAGRSGWDPEKVTVVDQRYQPNVTQTNYSGEGTVTMTSYHPDLLRYSFSATEKQLVVFSEVYYENGWKAYLDGTEVPISRVNYLLRAIEVPAGDHTIELAYRSEIYYRSAGFAWTGSFILLGLFVLGFLYGRKLPKEAA